MKKITRLTMAKSTVSEYTGYRHTAYSGYQCSWGIIMGLGGDSSAFATDPHDCECDHECECPTEFGKNWMDSDACEWGLVLRNLDSVMEGDLNDWKIGKIKRLDIVEYWGNSSITITLYQKYAKIFYENNIIIRFK